MGFGKVGVCGISLFQPAVSITLLHETLVQHPSNNKSITILFLLLLLLKEVIKNFHRNKIKKNVYKTCEFKSKIKSKVKKKKDEKIEILRDKTMDDMLIYIPNDNKQNCNLLAEKFEHY